MQRPLHVLLLEDDDSDAQLISSELRRGGIDHIERRAAGREDFLAALSEFRPELILTDYRVPGFNGMEALSVARNVCPDVPVIMVTGCLGEGLAVETIRSGAADYILKDRLSQLVPAVVRAVREAEERKQRRRAEVMLELKYQQLSLKNEALQQSEERFRQLAETIREVFWMTDTCKNQILYVSPAYEEIWGRSCASLYASPRAWLDAIHPEDRDRVVQAALHKQVLGEYDEEYRIVRPDGSVRWIHDRGFPVRDETGAVYRVVGVAEDITVRKNMERQVLEISDREQGRIGRDLHDGLCQLLVSIGFNANALKQDLEHQSRPEAAATERIGRKITDAIKMARHLAHGLSPMNLQSGNLAVALDQLARNTTEDYGVVCAAECSGPEPETDSTFATHAYRIAQEAVHNAVKHARASRILIRLATEPGLTTLTVTDDGIGIPADAQNNQGMGLEIIKYRAGMLSGMMEIKPLNGAGSEARRGTILTCTFPQKALE
jgi:PAS domain S-box-containing protein